jgi:hypothetical protein
MPDDLLGDLLRQLAGGREHEGARLAGAVLDALDHRQAEGGGLAGAGLGADEHVLAGDARASMVAACTGVAIS